MPARYRKREVDGRTVNEHRQIMEEHLGRKLGPDELVHHRNHNPFDNDLDNLEVLSHQAHSQLHNQKHPLTKLCAVCGEEFTPHPTKRKRAKTCSPACHSAATAETMRAVWAQRRASK